MPKSSEKKAANKSSGLATTGLFKKGLSKETKSIDSTYSDYTTFVLAPTLPEYPKADVADLKSEFSDLQTMAEKDIRYLTSLNPKIKHVYPNVIFTGYSGAESKESKLTECINALASAEVKEVNFVLTAHGSPGENGKFGMGWDDDSHPAYRLNVADLINILKESGIDKLKECQINFSFRCCNSAYVPLNRFEKSDDNIKKEILEKSFIGTFYRAMQELEYSNISVTGFRGFYRPGVKAVELTDTHGGKKLFPVADGTISIQANGEVTIPEKNKLLKIQNPKLDQIFEPKAGRKLKA